MSLQNASVKVTQFIISGLDTTESPVLVGVVMLCVYNVAVVANTLNIFVIIYNKKLHKPMYLLICNLSVVDILQISNVSPTIIGVLVAGVKTISYVPCLTQFFVAFLGAVMEMFSLAVMAFDRLIAVSCPFQYHRYLTNARIVVITLSLWIVASGFACVITLTIIPLPHCYTMLKYTFCDYAGIIRTTCVNPEYYFNLIAFITLFLTLLTFSFICLSYVVIIFFVKLSSTNDKMKMGSTCLSHFIVVTCYYLPTFIYSVVTRFGVVLTLEVRNGLKIMSIIGPSVVNPFVYCLRMKEIKIEIVKLFKRS